MALALYFDHRLDHLADALTERVSLPSSAHPLAVHSVVVPSVGVGRWLQQHVAARVGVCTRLEPELPGRLLWSCLRRLLPELPARSPFDPALVRWRLLQLFETLPAAIPELGPLRQWLARAGGAQRLAIATEVASAFDRYLAWRRDWLERWERGEDVVLLRTLGRPAASRPGAGALGPHEGWQRWLWRALLETMPGLADRHPYERLEALMRSEPALVNAALGNARLSVFGMPGMSPAQFELFGLLGEVADVAFFAPDPCREWWEDLLDRRSRARILAARPDTAWLYDGEPSVLGDWGRAQRDFVAQVAGLQERFGVQAYEPFRELEDPDERPLEANGCETDREPIDEVTGADCLTALRRAVFLRSDEPWQAVSGPDDSIVIHGAHSAIRQAEVLHDVLLDGFERLPGLRPSDIAVFCPDIESAASAVEAVFASTDDRRRIPVAISGRSPRADPLLRAALELPMLAARGPDMPAVEAWLLNPAVAEASGLSADDVARLMRSFASAGARWGLDAADGAHKHSWQDAFDRLLIGAAVSAEVALVGDLAPVSGLRGSRAAELEPVLGLFDTLRTLRTLAAARRSMPEWCREFGTLIERLFGATRLHEVALARVREALAGLSDAALQAGDLAIDAVAFRFAFEEALAQSAPAATASGAVTICPIGALRGVPFRVVCLFGMDEASFPRRGARTEADLMLRAPRFGDRNSRIDDRGSFLDAVLAARDRLVILFRGRDAKDDSLLNASPVVLELLQYLRARLRVSPDDTLRRRAPSRADASAILEHALHPFAPRNFTGDGCHAVEWLPAATVLARPVAQRDRLAGPLVAQPAARSAGVARAGEDGARPGEGKRPGERARPRDGGLFGPPRMPTRDAVALSEDALPQTIALEALRGALADPLAFWLRQRLGVALPTAERQIENLEPMWPDESRDRDLLDSSARKLLAGKTSGRLEAALRAAPATAGGAIGHRQTRAVMGRAELLVTRAGGADAADRLADIALALDDGHTIRARLPLPRADGRQRIVSGYALNLHGLIEAWLRHALVAAWLDARPATPGVRSEHLAETILVAPDAIARVRINDPRAALHQALESTAAILASPPVAFPRAWLAAWRESRQTGPLAELVRAGDRRGAAARRKLVSTIDGGNWWAGEIDRPWQALFWRDARPDPDIALHDGDRLWAAILADIDIEWERAR